MDPLLEKAKGKFSKAAQMDKKRQLEWAGRPGDRGGSGGAGGGDYRKKG